MGTVPSTSSYGLYLRILPILFPHVWIVFLVEYGCFYRGFSAQLLTQQVWKDYGQAQKSPYFIWIAFGVIYGEKLVRHGDGLQGCGGC